MRSGVNALVFSAMLASLLLLPLSRGSAQTWVGGTGNWSNPLNWSPQSVPGDFSIVYIDGGKPIASDVTYDVGLTIVDQLTLDADDSLRLISGNLLINTSASISGRLDDYSLFEGLGTTNINSGGTFNNYATIYYDATINNNIGGTLNNYSGFLTYGTTNNYSTLNNTGSILTYGTLNNYATLNNSGWLQKSNAVNYNDTAINNTGTINNGGTIYLQSSLQSQTALNNTGTINNGGTINITVSGTLNNSGTVNDYHGGQIYNSGIYSQSAGSTVVDGLFSSSTAIQINGGMLSGSGTIQGDVAMGGTLSPGDSPGTLTIQGNYTQLTSGTFFAELAGLTPGTLHDQLVVSGTATLDGTLDVVLLNGFVVQLGDNFVLMTFSNETGQFGMLDLPKLSGREMWQLSYNATDLTLSVVPTPEPSTFLLLGSGLLGMAGMLHRKTNL